MCGIIGYIGRQEACPILIQGLERLEYRGYDSAGIALIDKTLSIYKKKGKVENLVGSLAGLAPVGHIGIGHTRWATHGPPEDRNAHPHTSQSGHLALVHNGIIENYLEIKDMLVTEGHTFTSDTDTEVLAHYIETIQTKHNLPLYQALEKALMHVVGAYALCIIDDRNPNEIIVAKKGSPLVIGLGTDEFFVASDASPIIAYTKNVVYLEDNQIARMHTDGSLEIQYIGGARSTPHIEELSLSAEDLEKGGYTHYMQKEIFEQEKTIENALRGHIGEDGTLHVRGYEEMKQSFLSAEEILIIGCGTSYHAGLVAKHIFETLTRIPVRVEQASEFRYSNPILKKQMVACIVSQSGETADSVEALKLLKEHDIPTYGIVNVVGSTIARLVDAGSFIHVGPEISVASTKAFTGQVTLLTLLALVLATDKETYPHQELKALAEALHLLPTLIQPILDQEQSIIKIAQYIEDKKSALFLGRSIMSPVAQEGALKLKEISYIHSEGLPAGEMKHGSIALLEPGYPVVILGAMSALQDKLHSNISEVKARGAQVIGIVFDNTLDTAIFDYTIIIPKVPDLLSPLLSVIPLQLLAYHTAVLKNVNVDKPRNLAKSVTVE